MLNFIFKEDPLLIGKLVKRLLLFNASPYYINSQNFIKNVTPYYGLNQQLLMLLGSLKALLNLNTSTGGSFNSLYGQGLNAGINALTSQLGNLTGNLFDNNTELGALANLGISTAISTAGNTLANNAKNLVTAVKTASEAGKTANSLISGLGNNMKNAGLGLAISYGTNKLGQLSNKWMGNTKTSRFINSAGATAAAQGLSMAAGLGGGINPASIVGAGLSAAFGPSKEYQGKYGGITQGLDIGYDAIQIGANFFGPVGMAVSGLMGLNKGLSNIFGSTSGMCVCAGTKVYTADGRYINIEDLKLEDGIIGWNEKTHEIRPQKIDCIVEPTLKECIKIELDNGRILECSIDHPILSNIKEKAESHRINGQRIAFRNWEFRRADELKVGNWVGLAINVDFWGNKELPNAYLVGMLIGDGSYTYESSCKLWTADPSTWKYLENNNLAVLIGLYTPENSNEKYSIENRDYRIINGMQLVKDLGIAYQSGKNKTLPKNIDLYNKESICKLIAGLFDTDGSFSVSKDKKSFSLTLYLSNLPLLEQVKHLLYKLGIISSVSTRKPSINKMKNGRTINSNISYRLEIADRRSILNFLKYIPINIDYKKENLLKICNIIINKKDKDHYELSGARLAKIIAITPLGLQTVYNLSVSEDHTYLANDIITHNTTQDAILGSAFAGAPLKWLNMAGAKTTDKFGRQSWQNTEKTNAFMGNSFGDLADVFEKAREEAGKTYGTFSRGAYNRALANIQKAKTAWDKILAMADQNEYLNIRSLDMTSINNLRYALMIQGGWNPIYRGKMGMKILNNQIDHNRGMRYLSAAALIDNKQMILSNWN